MLSPKTWDLSKNNLYVYTSHFQAIFNLTLQSRRGKRQGIKTKKSDLLLPFRFDELVKSPKTPSPLMPACACPHADRGEGRGEGENTAISSSYVPLSFIPSHQVLTMSHIFCWTQGVPVC